MAKKNRIFSGKRGRGPTYEQFWENYLENHKVDKDKEAKREEARRQKSIKGKLEYAKRLAEAQKDVEYKGKMYSPGSNRMRYLMEQLDKGQRERLRKGIYDDSNTQRLIAEKMIEKGDLSDAELEAIKREAKDIYNKTNREQAQKYGPPKRGNKKPKPKL